MCNACGNVCCGSDQFGGCGCDGCDEPDCWSDDDEFGDDDDFGLSCACAKSPTFQCAQIKEFA